jgi:hypothetical protein
MDTKRLPVPVAVREWGDRYYFNLQSASRRWRGDSTAKIWRRKGEEGVIHYEPGRGMRSPQFAADLEQFLAFLSQEGYRVVKH